MISHLCGTIEEKTATQVVIDVGGMGFACGVSTTTAAALPMPGSDEQVKVYTRMAVRDDAIALFGFASAEERTAFDRLVGVNGVGPKLALSVLSTFSPEALREVVALADEKRMASVPGVGKKTAQRMILELKDAFKGDAMTAAANAAATGTAGTASSAVEDASLALLTMGFSPQEVDLALRGYDGDAADAEAAIRFALKRLGSNA